MPGITGLWPTSTPVLHGRPAPFRRSAWFQPKRKTPRANGRPSCTGSHRDLKLILFSESGSHRQPLAACLVVGDFVVPTHQPLTNPLDALLLPRVLRWVAVVFRQKSKCGHLDAADGRPWSRIPAKDLAQQLEREEGLEVSVRRIQRSLSRLVEHGHLARCQRTKWWGQRDFWYSWSDEEWALQQHRPTAVGRSSSASAHNARSRRPEASVASHENLSTPLNIQTSSKTERTAATSSLNGNSACAGPESRSGSKRAHSPLSASKDRLQGLQRVVQRATARGFGASKEPSEPTVQPESWVEGNFRFSWSASGHLVKDSLATAPLR